MLAPRLHCLTGSFGASATLPTQCRAPTEYGQASPCTCSCTTGQAVHRLRELDACQGSCRLSFSTHEGKTITVVERSTAMQACSVSYEMLLMSWLMLERWGRTDSWGGRGTTPARFCQRLRRNIASRGSLSIRRLLFILARRRGAFGSTAARKDTLFQLGKYGEKYAYLPDRRSLWCQQHPWSDCRTSCPRSNVVINQANLTRQRY